MLKLTDWKFHKNNNNKNLCVVVWMLGCHVSLNWVETQHIIIIWSNSHNVHICRLVLNYPTPPPKAPVWLRLDGEAKARWVLKEFVIEFEVWWSVKLMWCKYVFWSFMEIFGNGIHQCEIVKRGYVFLYKIHRYIMKECAGMTYLHATVHHNMCRCIARWQNVYTLYVFIHRSGSPIRKGRDPTLWLLYDIDFRLLL